MKRHPSAYDSFKDDLIEYIKRQHIVTHTPVKGGGMAMEVWYYTTSGMPLKECTRLNRLLGLNKINHMGNTNGIRHK